MDTLVSALESSHANDGIFARHINERTSYRHAFTALEWRSLLLEELNKPAPQTRFDPIDANLMDHDVTENTKAAMRQYGIAAKCAARCIISFAFGAHPRLSVETPGERLA